MTDLLPRQLPGAVATVVCLAGLRVFSGPVFEPLIASNAVSYGALGTVLIVQSWLIGVGWVVHGGQLFGRWFRAAWLGTCVTGTIAPAGRSNDKALRWASVILYLLLRAAWRHWPPARGTGGQWRRRPLPARE